MEHVDSPENLEVLQELYERSLEKWCNKLGRAKKDAAFHRMKTMEARLDGDLLLEDVLEGIHRMEAMQKHIDQRFSGNGPIYQNSAGAADAVLREALFKLTTLDTDSQLSKKDALHLFALFNELQCENAATLARLSGLVEAAEAAVKQRENEQLKKDANFKRMAQLWRHDMQKRNAEVSPTRQNLGDGLAAMEKVRSQAEERVTALQRELEALQQEISVLKSCPESSSHSTKTSGDECSEADAKEQGQELCRLRSEMADLKEELYSLFVSCPEEVPEAGGGRCGGQEIFYHMSAHLTSKWEDLDESGVHGLDMRRVMQWVRSQRKLHADQTVSLRQQVEELTESLRAKSTELASVLRRLEKKEVSRDLQRPMMGVGTLDVEVQKAQSSQCSQRMAMSYSSPIASEHHDVDSLSKVNSMWLVHTRTCSCFNAMIVLGRN